jgi:hypothetical protein
MVLWGVRGLGIGEAAVGFGWMYACFTPGVARRRASSWLFLTARVVDVLLDEFLSFRPSVSSGRLRDGTEI